MTAAIGAIEPIARQTGAGPGPTAGLQPTGDDEAAFAKFMQRARALQSGHGPASGAMPPPAVSDVSAVRAADRPPHDSLVVQGSVKAQPASLGDTILKAMNQASAEVQNAWQTLPSTAANVNMNTGEALVLQAKMMLMTVQCEMLGKAASKVTQDIDQTVRMQ